MDTEQQAAFENAQNMMKDCMKQFFEISDDRFEVMCLLIELLHNTIPLDETENDISIPEWSDIEEEVQPNPPVEPQDEDENPSMAFDYTHFG